MADLERLRVLSWNVHGYVGRARRRKQQPVLAAVQQFDADIVALQEIDERTRAHADVPDFEHLPRLLDRHAAEARTIRSPAGDYGHLLMSRWPLADVACLDLAVRRREPRQAISARIETPAGAVRVVAAHLGLSARERRHQIGLIRRYLDAREEAAAIVLGDFNDWRRNGHAERALCPPFVVAACQPSIPAVYPVLPLDRIWFRSRISFCG